MAHHSSRRLSLDGLSNRGENGVGYWYACDAQSLFGYSKWQNLEVAIKRAVTSTETSKTAGENHFADFGKMVDLGSEALRRMDDHELTRCACHPIGAEPRREACQV